MDLTAILFLLAVLVLTGLFVARPFLERRRMTVVSGEEQEVSSLMAERDRLITTLQELDFDYTLGKIPTDDYPGMRATLMQHAADVLRKLDAGRASDVENRIETAIAARRADAAVNKVADVDSDEQLEALIASRKSARKEKSAGFCAKCGKPVMQTDRFCPHCGNPVK